MPIVKHPRAIPITAMSAINALGRTTREVLEALDRGQSGLGPSPLPTTMETVVGAVAGDLPPLEGELAPYDCRLARLGMIAFAEVQRAFERAVARWGPDRVGIVLGTSTGGLEETEQAFFAWLQSGAIPARYDYERQHNFAAFGDLLASISGARGPTYVVSTACSSSGKVASSAARLMRAGIVDACLVGGIDSLTRMTLQGFHSLGILSSKPCKPFAADRDGINIGEGAAFFLMEREGDAGAYVLGVGESSDAYRMSSPEPTGRGAREAMERALIEADMTPREVDHVNAHGTATKLNDSAEALAIEALFGEQRVPVSSTKGYTGHLLGAAGATEVVFAAHAVLSGRIPQTIGCDPLDPEVRIHVQREAAEGRYRRVLSNSFAFGGSNVSVLIGEPK